ncbi:MAG: glycosyltransferase family 4 protein [Bacteroidetes bacterium]|nr:glycosyltransferase family 4 protein [Bacteroidota bacterium]
MMRIGFDAKRFFHNSTGLGNYSRSMVYALARHFQQDEFWLLNAKPVSFDPEFPNLHLYVPNRPTPLWRSLGIARDIQALQIPVFHGLSNEIPVGLSRKNIRSVVTIHDVIFRRFPDYYPILDRNIYHFKTRYAATRADCIIATSQATAADLQEFYGVSASRIHVVYQPVAETFYTRPVLPQVHPRPFFLYVSSFTGRKNQGALIEAFGRIRKLTDMDLILAGKSGETLETCRNMIRSAGLQDRIHLFTDCETEILQNLVHQCEAFVYPSLYEGFGIPLAEAAAAGKPMAVSNIGVFRELAGPAALYFHPNKMEEIADAMLKLQLTDHTLPMAKARETLLEKLEPGRLAAQLMQLYRQL